ncbi:hydrolase [Bordetella pertussis]|nr:hydrolase [Bordetella pertussis]
MLGGTWGGRNAYMQSLFAMRAAPALVLGARDDQIVPFALQQQLARVLPGAQLRPLEHGGHFFPIVRGADYVAALLDWFGHHSL